MPNADDGEGKGKRNLVRWDDDKDKQLLLCLQYACVKAGIRIPWDKVAQQMGPRFSSGACVQHLAKLRNRMKEENIPVPPPLPRGMVTTTPSRVYAVATSGKRRRYSSDDEDDEEYPALNPTEDSPTPKPSSKKRKATKKEPDIKEESDVMPELYDSDQEYGATKKKASKSKSKAKKPSPKKNNRRKSSSQSADARESTPVTTPRTRGVRKNYAQMQAPIEDLEDVKVETADESDEPILTETVDGVAVDAQGNVVEDVESDQEEVKTEEASSGSNLASIPTTPTGTALPASRGLPQAPTPVGNGPGGSGIASDPYVLNMRNPNQGLSQWGYGMFPGALNGPAYPMPNGYMGNVRFPYQNFDEDEEKPMNFGTFTAFNGSNNGMTTLTAPMALPSHGLSQNDAMTVLGGVDGIDVSPVSRNSSKESVKSQDSLMGAPAQTANDAGEELDLAAMEDASRWNDTNFEEFMNLQ